MDVFVAIVLASLVLGGIGTIMLWFAVPHFNPYPAGATSTDPIKDKNDLLQVLISIVGFVLVIPLTVIVFVLLIAFGKPHLPVSRRLSSMRFV